MVEIIVMTEVGDVVSCHQHPLGDLSLFRLPPAQSTSRFNCVVVCSWRLSLFLNNLKLLPGRFRNAKCEVRLECCWVTASKVLLGLL